MSARDLCLSGATTPQLSALLQQFGPGGAMDGAVHSASAQKRAVGGIYDGIHLPPRDVVAHNFYFCHNFIAALRPRASGPTPARPCPPLSVRWEGKRLPPATAHCTHAAC